MRGFKPILAGEISTSTGEYDKWDVAREIIPQKCRSRRKMLNSEREVATGRNISVARTEPLVASIIKCKVMWSPIVSAFSSLHRVVARLF